VNRIRRICNMVHLGILLQQEEQ